MAEMHLSFPLISPHGGVIDARCQVPCKLILLKLRVAGKGCRIRGGTSASPARCRRSDALDKESHPWIE